MTSVIKDLRLLLWPAAAILAATILPLALGANAPDANALAGWSLRVAIVALVLGTALLVALPFGAEFQQRTLVLLLSQPVTRVRIWTQKWGALLAILLLLLVVQYAVLPGGTVPAHIVLTFVALMACSGPFWTLVAGSTIGGAVFSLAALLLIEMTASLSIAFVTGSEIELFANRPTLLVVRTAYAGLTLWLGWRTFARYEVTGGGDGPGGQAIGSLRGFEMLRSRPHGAVANLVRKELRLQQPTFLIAAVFLVCWLAALLLLALSPERPDVADVVLTVLLVSYVPLSLIVASTISVGEDTSLGIHAWHLTYPVSSATQWFVKIGITLAVAAVLGVALPLSLAALVPAAAVPAGSLQLPSASTAVLLALSVSLVGFWTSTLARQTVRAAVMTGVALAVFALIIIAGGWLGWRVGTGTQLFTWIMVQWQLPPESLHPFAYGLTSRRTEWLALGVALCLLTPLALRQSLAAFRTARIDRRRIVKSSVQLGIVALLAAFIPGAGIRASGDLYRSQPVRELELALAHLATRSIAPSAADPVSVSLDELDATGLLSERTRRWLAGTRISLQLRPYKDPAGQEIRYLQTRVTFPNGRESRMLSRLPDQ